MYSSPIPFPGGLYIGTAEKETQCHKYRTDRRRSRAAGCGRRIADLGKRALQRALRRAADAGRAATMR